MAEPTGTIHEELDGKSYELRLTTRGIATLQEKHGNNVAGLLDGTAGDLPNFGALLDLVSVALQKGSKMPSDDADELADDMLTNDTEVVGRIIAAAFPEPKPGKSSKPKTKAA